MSSTGLLGDNEGRTPPKLAIRESSNRQRPVRGALNSQFF
jgi:hypothetical protein